MSLPALPVQETPAPIPEGHVQVVPLAINNPIKSGVETSVLSG